MTRLHAKHAARDALSRLEPCPDGRSRIPGARHPAADRSAINLIVQPTAGATARAKLTAITEIVGMGRKSSRSRTSSCWSKRAHPGRQGDRRVQPTGLRPKILDRIFTQGIPLPKEITAAVPAASGYSRRSARHASDGRLSGCEGRPDDRTTASSRSSRNTPSASWRASAALRQGADAGGRLL